MYDGSLWASPRKCSYRFRVVKEWHESPDENMRNTGSHLISVIPTGTNYGKGLFVQFRNRGIYFWDEERLKGWDAWDEFEDRFRDPEEICTTCGTICSA
jgi:hypothetical protein